MRSDLAGATTLGVRLNGRRIGSINRLQGEHQLFAFEPDYLDDPERPTLSLAFKGRSGGIVAPLRAVARRVPPFFSNLLPEGHLREYLARQAGVNPQREFFLLAALGGDLPGAVTVDVDPGGGRAERSQAAVTDKRGREEGPMRFSLAGVQLKFSAVMEAWGGLTVPAGGAGGAWIVKLPSAQFDSVPENEFAMLRLARAVGIETPESRLIPVGEVGGLPAEARRIEGLALAVERFDRGRGGRRIHMEDFAQVFGLFPEDKYKRRSYANIAAVLWAEAGERSLYEFVRRVAFSVAIGNADLHLKNWSVLYPNGRSPELSPAYDFVSTVPYLPGDELALGFGGERSLGQITLEQVRRFTDVARLPVKPVWEVVMETVERTKSAWKTLAEKDLLGVEIGGAIGRQIGRVNTRKL